MQYLLISLLAIDCSWPTNISNGQVDTSNGTTFGSIATYTCNTGYTLSGSQSGTCGADGIWSFANPTCTSEFSLHAKPLHMVQILESNLTDINVQT